MIKRYLNKTIDIIIIISIVMYVLLPLFVVVEYAFAKKWYASHWWFPQELGLKHFVEMFTLSNVGKSIFLSYLIASFVTLFTLIIGLLAGYVLGTKGFREKFRSARFVESLSNMPLAFPAITLGLGLYPIYANLGILNTIPGVIFAHMVRSVPYALRSIVGAFLTIPSDYDETSSDHEA